MIATLLKALVRAYQVLFSPWIGGDCRFEPSCSAYAWQALDRHGAVKGSYLAARRLLRCHPGCVGGHDPVPERPAAGPARSAPWFTRLVEAGRAPDVPSRSSPCSSSNSESSP